MKIWLLLKIIPALWTITFLNRNIIYKDCQLLIIFLNVLKSEEKRITELCRIKIATLLWNFTSDEQMITNLKSNRGVLLKKAATYTLNGQKNKMKKSSEKFWNNETS